jgi:hypothetical protein
MVFVIDLTLIILVIAIVIGAYLILRSLVGFIVNAIVGLIILYLANVFAGLGIGFSWLVILICALGGVLGAILVIVLHLLGIAF